jgi:hypothetical protein
VAPSLRRGFPPGALSSAMTMALSQVPLHPAHAVLPGRRARDTPVRLDARHRLEPSPARQTSARTPTRFLEHNVTTNKPHHRTWVLRTDVTAFSLLGQSRQDSAIRRDPKGSSTRTWDGNLIPQTLAAQRDQCFGGRGPRLAAGRTVPTKTRSSQTQFVPVPVSATRMGEAPLPACIQ